MKTTRAFLIALALGAMAFGPPSWCSENENNEFQEVNTDLPAPPNKPLPTEARPGPTDTGDPPPQTPPAFR